MVSLSIVCCREMSRNWNFTTEDHIIKQYTYCANIQYNSTTSSVILLLYSRAQFLESIVSLSGSLSLSYDPQTVFTPFPKSIVA